MTRSSGMVAGGSGNASSGYAIKVMPGITCGNL